MLWDLTDHDHLLPPHVPFLSHFPFLVTQYISHVLLVIFGKTLVGVKIHYDDDDLGKGGGSAGILFLLGWEVGWDFVHRMGKSGVGKGSTTCLCARFYF